jgi:hypothetical protein
VDKKSLKSFCPQMTQKIQVIALKQELGPKEEREDERPRIARFRVA